MYGYDCRFFMIYMEYLPYPDLSRQRNGAGMFEGELEVAASVLKDMAKVLVYLGQKQVLHNDIKPQNIINYPYRGAVLIDFGLASKVGEKDRGGGTLGYLPPEKYAGCDRVPKSDIYALGITLTYLLKKTALPDHGIKPWKFHKNSPRYKAWMVKVTEMRRELANGTDTGVVGKIVSDMLKESPDERISAEEILARLKEGGSGEEVKLEEVSNEEDSSEEVSSEEDSVEEVEREEDSDEDVEHKEDSGEEVECEEDSVKEDSGEDVEYEEVECEEESGEEDSGEVEREEVECEEVEREDVEREEVECEEVECEEE